MGPRFGSDNNCRTILVSRPVSSAILAIKSSFSLARTNFSKYELLAVAATRNWPLRNWIGFPWKPLGFTTAIFSVGVVDFLARSRAIMRTMTMRGIPVREMVGVDSEGKTPLAKTSRTAYATADQMSSRTVFNSRFLVGS
jgi:hypothetical protein